MRKMYRTSSAMQTKSLKTSPNSWGGKRAGAGRPGRGISLESLTFRIPAESKQKYKVLRSRGIEPEAVTDAITNKINELYGNNL